MNAYTDTAKLGMDLGKDATNLIFGHLSYDPTYISWNIVSCKAVTSLDKRTVPVHCVS